MNVYEIITARILHHLEQGTVPWRKPWRGGPAGHPVNAVTARPYRGINVFLLALAGFAEPRWLTFKQAKTLGGAVRKGERGLPIIFWRWLERERDGKTERIPVLRYYTVFNVAQCEGLPSEAPAASSTPFEPLAHCDAVLAGMPLAPTMCANQAGAWYSPTTDLVAMPAAASFESREAYYATLFHELTHATGHPSRLDRPAVADPSHFGSHAYSKEELVAEMGAAFLCGHCGIDAVTLPNAAAYIQSWIGVLRGDARLVVHAAAQAQRAVDFILGRGAAGDDEPA